ncbi:substrate-binding periplasmic protein [Azospirillum griseum]|uniref:Amino acid ABC transporter substrate-binding protein n=1 Tax=Azospirillum griseum TaxID=2496639 RepID=A0A3S0HXC4_9PROT|nr:transporter substrate-binding domain-containing protein [Azospirillum griseum]RTR15026.1 amino acid ABC transporter substrate-binding protein [Azospirillum griseum]
MRQHAARRLGLAALFALLAGSAQAACSMTVAWESYGKYSSRAADGALVGIDIDLMREVGKRIGCAIAFREMPFKRVLIEMENGTVDASTSVKPTPDRLAYAHFSAPYYHQPMTLFVKKGSAGRYTLKSLADAEAAKFRIGVIGGYYYGDEFEGLRAKPSFAALVEEATDYATNIRKLVDNRVQGIMGDSEPVVLEEARKAGFDGQIELYPIALPNPGLHLMFARKTVPADRVAAIDAALATMKADGTLAAIMARYGDS